MTVSVHCELRRRALIYATGNKESTSETIEAAIIDFINDPRLSVRTGFGSAPARTFDGIPYLDGPREEVKIDSGTCAAARECAKTLGVTLDQLVDLAVANACLAIGDEEVTWKVAGQ